MDHSFNSEAVVHCFIYAVQESGVRRIGAIQKGFMLIGGAEAAAEVEDCVVIVQR